MDAERMERLIAAVEASANANNRLAQVLEQRETKKRAKAQRVRRTVPMPLVVSERVERIALQALARHQAGG